MIAVCPLTTAGAPSKEAKEPAIAQIPKPTAPMPANIFNPLVIMVSAPKSGGGGCMIDGQTSADARPLGTHMLSPPPVLHIAKTKRRRAVSVLEHNRPGFESRHADFCDRNVRGLPRSEGVQNFVIRI
jgi:hypothetical protein